MPDTLFYAPVTEEALQKAVEDIASHNIKYLIIDGGDGTVSKVLTALYALSWPQETTPPVLVVLPSGNTNLVAADVGFGLRGEEALQLLMSFVGEGQVSCDEVRRSPLVLSWPDRSHRPVLGFFGGLGAFTRSIEIAHRPGFLKTFSHEAAVIGAFALTVLKLLSPRSRKKWLDGAEVEICIDGTSSDVRRHFLLLCTALRRFPHGVWPFWQNTEVSDTGIIYLDVAAHPERLTRAVWNLLRNRIPSWIRKSSFYKSGSAKKISLKGESLFVLDGEMLKALPQSGFEISAGPLFSFLQFKNRKK